MCYTLSILEVPVGFKAVAVAGAAARNNRKQGGFMVKRVQTEEFSQKRANAEILRRMMCLDEDLEIMDRHASDLVDVEVEVKDSMRRWDREHKNSRLHSVPRHLKHVR